MSTDRHRRVKKIFLAAAKKSPNERDALVNEACGGDEDLRREIESLLRFHDEEIDVLDTASLAAVSASLPWSGNSPRKVGKAAP